VTDGLDRASVTEMAGYRLQLTLVDLIDLTLQAQHVRWNLTGADDLRSKLDAFDALSRAGADAVADRLRRLGVAPDGRIGTAYQDLLFEPLPDGPLEAGSAVAAFTHRLTQFGSRLVESLDILEPVDPESARILAALNQEIADWAEGFDPAG
jgi:starvation-inducible DNA-binding protein